MAATAGILSQIAGRTQGNSALPPMDASTTNTGGTGSSSGDSATISANDFLTLLVTEMQNQDPTADTDPNEYINQLVQVNSLEQLISINQTLSTALGSSTTGTTTDAAGQTVDSSSVVAGASPVAAASTSQSGTSASALSAMPGLQSTPSAGSALQSFAARLAPGNLGIPANNPSAQRVAHALDGRRSAPPAAKQ
jgi:flagellar basal-body rod modification protein FlgD